MPPARRFGRPRATGWSAGRSPRGRSSAGRSRCRPEGWPASAGGSRVGGVPGGSERAGRAAGVGPGVRCWPRAPGAAYRLEGVASCASGARARCSDRGRPRSGRERDRRIRISGHAAGSSSRSILRRRGDEAPAVDSVATILLLRASRLSKCCLVADLVQEFDPRQFAIRVTGPVEQVDLQQRPAVRSTAGRVPRLATPARPCRVRRQASDLDDEHAAKRRPAVRKAQVQGRKAEFAAEPAAVDDAAAQPVGPPEQGRRPGRSRPPPAPRGPANSRCGFLAPSPSASRSTAMPQRLGPAARAGRSRRRAGRRSGSRRRSAGGGCAGHAARMSTMKSSAVVAASDWLKCATQTRSTFSSASASSLSRRLAIAHRRHRLPCGEELARMRLERQHAGRNAAAPARRRPASRPASDDRGARRRSCRW